MIKTITTQRGPVRIKIKPAKGLIAWFLINTDFGAITSPWRVVYVLPWLIGPNHRRLLRHELVHARQIEDDGRVKFLVRYAWWTLRYGYWNNPYEVEARKAEVSRVIH